MSILASGEEPPKRIYSLSDTFVTLVNQEEQEAQISEHFTTNSNNFSHLLHSPDFHLLFDSGLHPDSEGTRREEEEEEDQKGKKQEEAPEKSLWFNKFREELTWKNESKSWLIHPQNKLSFRRKEGDEGGTTTTTTDEECHHYESPQRNFKDSTTNSNNKRRTRFSKWSSRVKREETKLLRRLFRHFSSHNNNNKEQRVIEELNNELNINNSDYDKPHPPTSAQALTTPDSNPGKKVLIVGPTTRRSIPIQNNNNYLARSPRPKLNQSEKTVEEKCLAFHQSVEELGEMEGGDEAGPVSRSLPEMISSHDDHPIIISTVDSDLDREQDEGARPPGADDDKPKLKQVGSEDETSTSSYSTAEEDQIHSEEEDDMDLGGSQSYQEGFRTPKTSISASRMSLRSPDYLSPTESLTSEFASCMDLKGYTSEEGHDLSDPETESTAIFQGVPKEERTTSLVDSTLSEDLYEDGDRMPLRRQSKIEILLTENQPIGHKELQAVFDCFKEDNISRGDCDTLLESLGVAQRREDFQWALHQMGGFNALLVLYARVVEICADDGVQSKSLSLVLNQLRNHYRLTDGPAHRQYHLIRFVLNSKKSTFGFKTFIHLMNFCLSASGLKLIDYQLLDTCLLSCWKQLTRIRCKESDAPTGAKSLFECLLTIVLDLLEEGNTHRDLNAALLKANHFSETLLAISYHVIMDDRTTLSPEDALSLAALIQLILGELMAPPDAYVAVTLLKFGLCPLLPRELPPLPRKDEAFFMFRKSPPLSVASSRHASLKDIKEAEEAGEDRVARAGSDHDSDPESQQPPPQEFVNAPRSRSGSVQAGGEDVPEILGIQNGNSSELFLPQEEPEGPEGSFAATFQEALIESVMSILLNALSILPDNAFHSVVSPQMSAYLFVAYCSHPKSIIKQLSLKLLSAYLTRAKHPVVVDFLKGKGFYLTSIYVQGDPEVAPLCLNISLGFGPLSYPLIIGHLYSNQVVNTVMEWAHEDEPGVIPALLQMGLLPAIFHIHSSHTETPIQKPLHNLLSMVTRFCAVHPKDDPWKALLLPALESGYGTSPLVPRIVMEATEFLRRYKKTELRKADAAVRLQWLLERASVTRLGCHFDKWLLNIYTLHIMEMEESEQTEHWVYFVKKQKKKLNYLFGVFLCRIFSSAKYNMEFKHYAIRVLLTFCPHLMNWLPKVVRCEEKIERCFTAFIRIFFNQAEHRTRKLEPHLRTPSFHSLISDSGNLTLTLQMAGLHARHSVAAAPGIPGGDGEHFETESDPGGHGLSDGAIRAKFENLLVDSGIMSPTSNFSMFSADFQSFKLLLETPSSSGVSVGELRLCVSYVEKLRLPFLLGTHKHVVGKEIVSNCAYFDGVFTAVNKYAMDMLVNVARSRTQQEVEVARKMCVQDEDVFTVQQWVNVLEQVVHPRAPWHFAEFYPGFWALDQSEGPGRIRARLKREHLRVHSRFLLAKYRKSVAPAQPLDYLFHSHSADVLKHPLILNEIQFMRFCTRIIPGEELQGEIILTQEKLTFIAENAHYQNENVEARKTAIKYLMKRRYTLEDRAVEIFLECRSFLFVFKTKKDREEFVNLLGLKTTGGNGQIQFHSVNATLMETSITSMTSQWLKGQLSNFEYLMYLNTWAGRTYCDLMQYPVFPFVLAKYDAPTLDLYAHPTYRDLKKPMAIQDISKEEHFVSTYNYLKRECESAPFHYGSHYSNSGIVLHFLVRLPPYTQHFLKYQDGSFDIPDRSFHSVETTWRLASKESNTDFKEAIPEFFYLPEFLLNLQHFDLGVRQNGQRVGDVVLPPWSKGDARLFTLINRQALESSHVRKYLCDWIDLIFGYKQTGKAALQAINVFHPSTYEGFEVDASGDELLMRARKAMVSTYGQTPKQLFFYPHPRPSIVPEEKCQLEVLDTVWGIRWGSYVGSPACPDLDVIHTREYAEPVSLFETNSRVVFWPFNTVILGDNVVGYWNVTSIRIKTKIVYNSIGDDITACRGTTNSVWVGHTSGRISVLKLSPDSEKVLERTDLVGHYRSIKKIDVNQEFSVAISCAGENYAIMWDINKYPKIALINAIEVEDSIDDIHSSRSTGDIVLLNKGRNRVTLATINGHIVGSFEPEEQVDSVCLSSLDPGRNVNVMALGCDYGVIRFYSTWDLKFVNQIKVLPLASLAIKCIRYSRDGRRLYCMSDTDEGAVTVALQLSLEFKNH